MEPSSDDWSGIHDINALATKVRRIIRLIGWTLAALFTWLQLKDFEFGVVVESTTPELLLKTALIIYYFCWIGGTSFDLSVQQKVYVSDPAGGELKVKTYAAVVGSFIVVLLLLWASENEKFLAPVLTIFVVANYFGWRHIVSRMSRAVRVSREKFSQRKDYFRDEQLRLVNNYMTGKWQTIRFAIMLAITLWVNLVTFLGPVRQSLAILLGHFSSEFTVANLETLLPSLSILLFVVVAESWIWVKRAILAACISYVETLRSSHDLVRKES